MNKLEGPGINRSQQISKSVENLVHGLPFLQRLQLGDYKYVPAGCGFDPDVLDSYIIRHEQPNDEWQIALKWVEFVQLGAKSRADGQKQYEKSKALSEVGQRATPMGGMLYNMLPNILSRP